MNLNEISWCLATRAKENKKLILLSDIDEAFLVELDFLIQQRNALKSILIRKLNRAATKNIKDIPQ